MALDYVMDPAKRPLFKNMILAGRLPAWANSPYLTLLNPNRALITRFKKVPLELARFICS